MTNLRKAAEMALDALENVYGKGKRCEAAITVLRQALAQPEQDHGFDRTAWHMAGEYVDTAEQEPAVTEKDGSPCPEFWDWLPKAYNFEGLGEFTKYNMEVAFLAGKNTVLAQPEQESISRCKQCGGALPVTGALDRIGERDCIGQLKVISTIAWFNAPIKTEWGEDMMFASVFIDNNHTLTLYCERSQIHKVPNIIKEQA